MVQSGMKKGLRSGRIEEQRNEGAEFFARNVPFPRKNYSVLSGINT